MTEKAELHRETIATAQCFAADRGFRAVSPLIDILMPHIHSRMLSEPRDFKYRLAYAYVLCAKFWIFVGVGVFGGGTVNAPLVNCYEQGTFVTFNYSNICLFGAFGELVIGLIYFCLRHAASDWWPFSERLGLWAFWLCNGGLVLWIVLNFFPIGRPQLDAVYERGLAYARGSAFYSQTLFWQLMRLPADVLFAAGALLTALDVIVKQRLLSRTQRQSIDSQGGDHVLS